MAQIGQSTQGRGVTVRRTHGESPSRHGFFQVLGRKTWPLLHGMSDRWPCRRCRSSFSAWMSGLHDAVNIRIGRDPFRPEAWDRFRTGSLEGSFHPGCILCRGARWVSRLVAQVPNPSRFR